MQRQTPTVRRQPPTVQPQPPTDCLLCRLVPHSRCVGVGKERARERERERGGRARTCVRCACVCARARTQVRTCEHGICIELFFCFCIRGRAQVNLSESGGYGAVMRGLVLGLVCAIACARRGCGCGVCSACAVWVWVWYACVSVVGLHVYLWPLCSCIRGPCPHVPVCGMQWVWHVCAPTVGAVCRMCVGCVRCGWRDLFRPDLDPTA